MKRTTFSLLLLLAFCIGPAQAAVITYQATDLGGGRWQYDYTVSGHVFAADTGFTVYFDVGLYDLLDPFPAAPNADWDVLSWDPDPDPVFGGPGAYDALALVDTASLADAFSITFDWLGGAAGPGSQAFEIYDVLTFDLLGFGNTVAAPASGSVPTAPLLPLLGIGVLAALAARRRHS